MLILLLVYPFSKFVTCFRWSFVANSTLSRSATPRASSHFRICAPRVEEMAMAPQQNSEDPELLRPAHRSQAKFQRNQSGLSRHDGLHHKPFKILTCVNAVQQQETLCSSYISQPIVGGYFHPVKVVQSTELIRYRKELVEVCFQYINDKM